MYSKRRIGYMAAIGTSLAYSLWYIGSNLVVAPLHGTYTVLIPLLIVQGISSLFMFVFILAKSTTKHINRSNLMYPISAGSMYAFGNFIFYLMIRNSGLANASSFATAQVLIFAFLVLFPIKNRKALLPLYIGVAFVTIGLFSESLKLAGGPIIFNFKSIGEGLVLMAFLGVGTYLYYSSVVKVGDKFTAMFFIQFTEFILYGIVAFLERTNFVFSGFNGRYILLVLGSGLILTLSFYLETSMLKVVASLGKGATLTAYILSDLQLVPVLAYTLIINPNSWFYYAPGMVAITIGISLLEWK